MIQATIFCTQRCTRCTGRPFDTVFRIKVSLVESGPHISTTYHLSNSHSSPDLIRPPQCPVSNIDGPITESKTQHRLYAFCDQKRETASSVVDRWLGWRLPRLLTFERFHGIVLHNPTVTEDAQIGSSLFNSLNVSTVLQEMRYHIHFPCEPEANPQTARASVTIKRSRSSYHPPHLDQNPPSARALGPLCCCAGAVRVR